MSTQPCLPTFVFFISHSRFSCSGIGKASKGFLEEENGRGILSATW